MWYALFIVAGLFVGLCISKFCTRIQRLTKLAWLVTNSSIDSLELSNAWCGYSIKFTQRAKQSSSAESQNTAEPLPPDPQVEIWEEENA